MNYLLHYNKLIDRARTRVLDGYKEKHHILPTCLGGDDSLENLCDLTPEEHYTSHLLLIKIYPHENKLVWAAKMMTIGSHKNKRGNKLYGWLRKQFTIRQSRHRLENPVSWTTEMRLKASIAKKGKPGHKQTQETRDKISASNRGKKHSKETIEKIASKHRGKTHSVETRNKMSASHDRLPRFISEESRKTMSLKASLRILSEERKAKTSASMKGVKKPQIVCPYCNKIGGKPAMKKHHFDNCKLKPYTSS